MPTAWKKEIADNFGKRSSQYDQYCDVQDHASQQLISFLPDCDPSSILEIGCGTGLLTKKIIGKYRDASFRITDLSPEMIDISRKYRNYQNVEFAVMDGENPDITQKYDLIISNMAFQWFENLNASLENLKSLLNPGGEILYSVPGPNSFREWQDTLSGLGLSSGILDMHHRAEIFAEEEKTKSYKNAYDFLRSLKNIGAHHPKKNYEMLTHSQLKRACRDFDQKHNGMISWHILYGRISI